jgi:ribosomal protein S18 acetylase RimI-like enzyme
MTLNNNHLPIRPFSSEQDIPRLLSLYAAVEEADQEGTEFSEQTLLSQQNLPGHNPALDRWVIDAPDGSASLIASAVIILPPGTNTADAYIIVLPSARNFGIGTDLIARVIERAHQLNSGSIQIFANPKHADAPGFLQKHGFIQQGAFTELRLPEGTRLPPVIWPYGYTLQPYSEIQDISILTQAMNLSYIPLWGHREVSDEEMASFLSDFVQDGLFLVFTEKGRVIGVSRVEPSAERTLKNGKPTGYIDAPGIVPQHRRLDLYRALVLTGIKWLRDQGQTLIEMESWGDKLEVLKMYRELGFEDVRQLVSYKLVLGSENDTG